MNFNDLNPALQQILTDILLTLLAAALTAALVGIKHLLRSLQSEAGKNEYRLIQDLVAAGVRYAEQTGIASKATLAGEDKKKLAIQFAVTLLSKYGMKVTPENLDGIVEEVLYQELNWTKANSVPPLADSTG